MGLPSPRSSGECLSRKVHDFLQTPTSCSGEGSRSGRGEGEAEEKEGEGKEAKTKKKTRTRTTRGVSVCVASLKRNRPSSSHSCTTIVLSGSQYWTSDRRLVGLNVEVLLRRSVR